MVLVYAKEKRDRLVPFLIYVAHSIPADPSAPDEASNSFGGALCGSSHPLQHAALHSLFPWCGCIRQSDTPQGKDEIHGT